MCVYEPQVPSPWDGIGIGLCQTGVTGATAAQNGIVPTQTPAVMDGQQQATGWNVPQAATSPAGKRFNKMCMCVSNYVSMALSP